MMNLDIRLINTLLSQIAEEKDLPKNIIVEALGEAIAGAYKKERNLQGHKIKIEFSDDYAVKRIYEEKLVRADDSKDLNPKKEISLSEAQKIKSDVKEGDVLEFDLPLELDFGRIASQTARQVLVQRIKEMEKEYLFKEYKGRENEIFYSRVQRIEKGIVYLEIGKTTGVIFPTELMEGEELKVGQRIRALLYEVKTEPKGVTLYLTRRRDEFLKQLFATEIPEINQNIVEIKNLAREPGSRSKIAVVSNDPKIDPIGACVGQKGTRISLILNELGWENIDIIKWDENPVKFIQNALSPAKVMEVVVDEKEKKATVKVSKDQLSLAIGKNGQNVRLAAKLTDYKIDIQEIDEIK